MSFVGGDFQNGGAGFSCFCCLSTGEFSKNSANWLTCGANSCITLVKVNRDKDMPYQLEKIAEQPPLLRLNVQGSVTALDMDEHLESLRACIKANGWMEQHIYLIVDVVQCEMSFVDVITGAQTHSPEKRGSSAD